MFKINPSYEIQSTIPEPTDRMGVLKYLERIGRVCYKSEELISDESCIKFINNIRGCKHWAMLEHYIFVFSVTKEIFEDVIFNLYIGENDADYTHARDFIKYTYWSDPINEDYRYIISTSATALNYLWECDCFKEDDTHGIIKLCNFMKENIPELMCDPWLYNGIDTSGIRFLSRDEITSLPNGLRYIHDFRSVKFIVDRGVTHEIVRHRPASYAQESTRYCNYFPSNEVVNGKSNGKDLKLINPLFTGDNADKCMNIWNEVMETVERGYNEMIKLGAFPQQARSILPNSTKADIFMTARLWEFKHFFDMRVPKSAHPQMRQVTVPLVVDMHKETGCFEDQVALISEEDRIQWLS